VELKVVAEVSQFGMLSGLNW